MNNSLRAARDRAMDLQALNHRQRYIIANDTPEVDSLLEEFSILCSRYSIRPEDSVGIVRRFRELLELELAEYHGEREITGTLDAVLRAEHATARPALADCGPSIKRLASLLRPHLMVLAAPAGHSALQLIEARRTVTDIVRSTPADRLRSDTLRHELRATAHDELLARLTEDAA